ncbi:hypothetical protein D3C86_1949410 [compost metagenome]
MAKVNLYAASGATVLSSVSRLTEKKTLPTANLSSGLYLVHIRVDNQERTLKFIKQ